MCATDDWYVDLARKRGFGPKQAGERKNARAKLRQVKGAFDVVSGCCSLGGVALPMSHRRSRVQPLQLRRNKRCPRDKHAAEAEASASGRAEHTCCLLLYRILFPPPLLVLS